MVDVPRDKGWLQASLEWGQQCPFCSLYDQAPVLRRSVQFHAVRPLCTTMIHQTNHGIMVVVKGTGSARGLGEGMIPPNQSPAGRWALCCFYCYVCFVVLFVRVVVVCARQSVASSASASRSRSSRAARSNQGRVCEGSHGFGAGLGRTWDDAHEGDLWNQQCRHRLRRSRTVLTCLGSLCWVRALVQVLIDTNAGWLRWSSVDLFVGFFFPFPLRTRHWACCW